MTVRQLRWRQRRLADTRARIHCAAVELTDECGFAAVTVEQIRHRAAVSRRTFLCHFPDKESAVIGRPSHLPEPSVARFRMGWGANELFTDLAMVLIDLLAEGRAGDGSTLLALIRAASGDPALCQQLLGEVALLEKEFGSLIAERLELPTTHHRVLVSAAAFMASVRVAVRQWIGHPDQVLLYGEICSCAEQVGVLGNCD